MDSVSKRQVVLALFIALQSWKFNDWLVDLPTSLTRSPDVLDDLLAFFFKWTAIELGFLAALHYARIPKLDWKFMTRAMIYGGLCCVTLGMAVLAPAMVPGTKMKDILVDDVMGSRDALIKENTGHLMGEFTVKVKPWAIAKLNAEGAQLCLPTSTPPPNSHGLSEAAKRPIVSESEPHVLIPLSLSGTGPWTVTWEWGTALKKKKTDQLVMEEHHIEVFTSKNSHIYAGKVGYYRVSSIIDGNGSPGKIAKDIPQMVQVRSCPEARFDGLAIAGGMDLCLGRAAKHPLKIWLAGEAPFDLRLVRYSTSSKGSESTKTLSFSNLYPEPKPVEGLNKAGKFGLVALDLAQFDSVGEHLLRIESLQDTTGLERKYGEWDLGDSVLVTVHEPPSVSWLSNAGAAPFLLEGSTSPVTLEATLEGKGPFTAQIDVFDPADPQKLIDTIRKESSTNALSLDVKLPGIYRLASVSDALCDGSIVSPSDLVVRLIGRPTAKVDFRPIKSPCNGDLGGIFELDLTGNGPWKVTLSEQVQGGKPIRRTVGSDKPRLVYRWIPETPGTHSISFVGLADSYYPGGVPLTESRQLSVLPLPSAKIIAPVPDASGHVYTCLGSTQDIPVEARLTGIGPWKVEAQHIRPDKSTESLTWDIPASEAKLKYTLPRPTIPGQHKLALTSVSDGHGCSKTLEDQSVTVNVLPKLPSASFAKTAIKARQDASESTVIPVDLVGNKGPWSVEYRFIAPNGKSQVSKVRLDSPTSGIPANREGTYELVSVRDQYCVGTIGDQRSASVTFIPMPIVTFDPAIKPTSCRSPPSDVTIKSSKGTGTIRVKYREQFSHDLADLPSKKATDHQITVTSNGSVNIPIKSDRVPGYYRYTLVSVSDDVFSDVDLLARGPPRSFTLHVLPDPTPRIVDQSALLHCLGASIKDARVQLDFAGSSMKGSAPHTISYELINEKREIIAVNGATIQSDGYLQLEDLKQAGMYYIRIVKAANAHGCIWEASEQERNLHVDQAVASGHALPIHVILSPTIKRVQSTTHACLGDTATFELGGTGPWTVSYTLTKSDGTQKHRTETLKTSSFSVLLAEPGSLRINSIKNAKCRLEDASLLPAPISVKALPTAAIEAGNQWVHEDEIASFKVRLGGEPPFSFTYQRLDENTKGVVLESQTIENVKGHEYTVEVPGVDGTFRIESVQDRWCRYPRLPLAA